jgi:hypothetical protein
MPSPRKLGMLAASYPRPRAAVGSGHSAGYDVALVREGLTPFSPPQLQVGLVTEAVLAVADPGPAGTLWTLLVRARSGNGMAGDPAELRLKLISDGTDLEARPNSPVIWSVRPLANGAVEIRWEHDDAYASVEAATFAVFASSSAAIDYGTPAATAQRYDRRAVLSGLEADVQYRVVVRAVSADGVQDGNTAARVVVPRNSPPPGLAAGAVVAEQV